MFPVSDVIPSRITPIATIVLIALTAAGFSYELRLDGGALQALVDAYGVTSVDFTWPSLVTALFLHAGWLHVGVNLLYLWLFGGNVEGAFGKAAFVGLYLLCGAVAGVTHVFVHPWSRAPMIGPGGAIAGLVGAYLVLYPRSRVLTAVVIPADVVEVPAVFFLGIWFLLQLFQSVGSIGAHVVDGALSVWSHVAGLATGAICGAYVRFATRSMRNYWS